MNPISFTKTDTSINVEFTDFDQAMMFVKFVAKLSRSKETYPTITIAQEQVNLAYQDEPESRDCMKEIEAFISSEQVNTVEQRTTPSGQCQLYTDGGSRGNPGPSASGFVLLDSEGIELARGGDYLGITTNNQAEYQSLRVGVEKALELGIRKLKVSMDSMLVVNQIKGTYKVKNRDLWPIYESIKTSINKLEEFEICHVPRELNKIADSIVNQILDEHIS